MVISLQIMPFIRQTAALFTLLALCIPAAAGAVDLVVPTDFTTIQAAIDRAEFLLSQPTNTNSYVVLVEPGTYPGGIILKSNIPLRGRETARTILSGGGAGTLITAANISGASVRNFTFRNAAIGILASGLNPLTIQNNVFSLGPGGIGVQVTGQTNQTLIVNNTFYNNLTAVTREANVVIIKNNIFANNTTNIAPFFSGITEPNITYNAFDPDRGATEPRGSFFIPNSAVPNPNPFFADAANLDFHLLSGPTGSSPCIDTGDPNINDPYLMPGQTTNISDMGAYGGPNADTIPLPVTILSAIASAADAISLSWSSNPAYTVKGFTVYYGHTSGDYSGTDALVSGVPAASPIDAGAATDIVLSGLTSTTAAPAAPVLNPPRPRNNGLELSWTSITGASRYTVHYGIASTAESTADAGSATSLILSGLTNGQTYKVAVSATAQATYYIAVTAYDANAGGRTAGVAHESAYSAEAAVPVGAVNTSGLSNEVTGMPEPIIAYPPLPNTGCFIATAAYGSPDERAVRVLREFRDRYLATNASGRAFIRWYYANSPAAARYIDEHPSLRPLVRGLLAPAVAAAFILNQTPAAAQAAVLLVLAVGVSTLVGRHIRVRSRARSPR